MRTITLALMLSLIACGGGGGGGSSDPIDVSGRFSAIATATDGTALAAGQSFELRFTLNQVNDTVEGTAVASGGIGYQLSGVVSGNLIDFVALGAPSCPGSFEGLAEVSDDSNLFVGRYAGADCLGSLVVEFAAVREP